MCSNLAYLEFDEQQLNEWAIQALFLWWWWWWWYFAIYSLCCIYVEQKRIDLIWSSSCVADPHMGPFAVFLYT
jgi:hypothetical protein